MQSIQEIEALIRLISKLPGLGSRSAKRIILRMINNREELMKPMVKAINDLYKNVVRCKICGTLKSTNNICDFKKCSIINKNFNSICVVENIADQWSVEASGIFSGYFHILGGTISSSQKKEELLINSLVERIKVNKIEELILATSTTTEGQTTAFYIQDALKDFDIKITKLALGIPVGADIENLDDGSLIYAFKNRKSLTKD
jgi:recombination protein RecR